MDNRRQNIRCCSFCRGSGHNVNNCNHIGLRSYFKSCAINRIIFDYQDINNSERNFTQWLIHDNNTWHRLIKAFASRYCQVPLKVDTVERINKVTRYFYGLSYSFIMNMVNPHNNYLVSLALTNYPVLINMNFQERIQYIRGLQNIIELLETPNNNVLDELSQTIIMKHNEPEHDTTTCLNNATECSICYNETPEKKYVRLNCNHSFCGDCVLNMMKKRTSDHIKCALCREVVKDVTIKDSEIMAEMTNYITSIV
jgi:hypothetical protein